MKTVKSYFSILLLIAGLLTFSCESDVYSELEQEQEYEDLFIDDVTPELKTWKDHVEYAIKNSEQRTQTRSIDGTDDIRCVGYEYKGKIGSSVEKQQLADEIFDDNAATVEEIGKFKYKIIPMSLFKQKLNLSGMDNPDETLKGEFIEAIEIGMDLVSIDWKYGDKMYNSIAVFDDNGEVVYDNIGHLMLDRVDTEFSYVPLKKSRGESVGSSIGYEFRKADHGTDYLGCETWSYEIECYVTGSETAKGKSIDDVSMHATHGSSFFWSCDAQIEEISSENGTNGKVIFAWGYCYGLGSVSLQKAGTGFTISGGSDGETGVEHVYPNELN